MAYFGEYAFFCVYSEIFGKSGQIFRIMSSVGTDVFVIFLIFAHFFLKFSLFSCFFQVAPIKFIANIPCFQGFFSFVFFRVFQEGRFDHIYPLNMLCFQVFSRFLANLHFFQHFFSVFFNNLSLISRVFRVFWISCFLVFFSVFLTPWKPSITALKRVAK